MDPVSAATLGWLRQQADMPGASGLELSVHGSDVRNALTQVARFSVQVAVGEVTSPSHQQVVLDALLREDPDTSHVVIAGQVDLPEAITAYVQPRLAYLSVQGIDVDSSRLAEAVSEQIMGGIHADASRGGPLTAIRAMFGLPPGTSFGDDDDDNDGDEEESSSKEGNSTAES